MRTIITLSALAVMLSACGSVSYADHIVGPDACRFSVPSSVRLASGSESSIGDTTVRSLRLEIGRHDLERSIPTLHQAESTDFSFIVSCENGLYDASSMQMLAEQGLTIPVTDSGIVYEEKEGGLYRIYNNPNRTSWVLLDFDPRVPIDRSSANKVVGTCHSMSISSDDSYRCVHVAQRGDVRIEYRFGPRSISKLTEIDQTVFSFLDRQRP